MIWIWVAVAVVVVALIVLAVVALGTARRLAPLEAALQSPEFQRDVEALSARAEELHGAVADVTLRVQMTQERIQVIKAARASD